MKTFYEISSYGTGIQMVSVVKETEHTVTIQRVTWDMITVEEKRKKATSYSKLYPTFEQAKQALVARLVKNREYLQDRLRNTEEEIKKVLDLTEKL